MDPILLLAVGLMWLLATKGSDNGLETHSDNGTSGSGDNGGCEPGCGTSDDSSGKLNKTEPEPKPEPVATTEPETKTGV